VFRLVPFVRMPSPLPRQRPMESIRSCPSIGFGLPRVLGGSAPASAVSGPARCYCAFGLHDSPSRLKRPSTPEASAASSPPPPLRLLPGGAIQFPGGNFNPRWTNALHGTPTRRELLSQVSGTQKLGGATRIARNSTRKSTHKGNLERAQDATPSPFPFQYAQRNRRPGAAR